MKDFSISMALVDYIPVILFAAASVILIRDMYNKMSKGAFALFAAGSIDIISAGFLKATYKLLYALNICDFSRLSVIFFPMQSLGFILAGIAILALLTHRQGQKRLCVVAPPVFNGTFIFIILIILGLGLMDIGLCIMAVKLKKHGLIALFAVSFVCSLCMGYLSSHDFDLAMINWIAEAVNIIGQGTFLVGAIIMHKNGFADLTLREEQIS